MEPDGADNTTEADNIPASLPTELLSAVFSILPLRIDALSAALVSRHWSGAAIERIWSLGPIEHSARSLRGFLQVLGKGRPLRELGVESNDEAWEPPNDDGPERRHLRAAGILKVDEDTGKGKLAAPKDVSDLGAMVRRVVFRGDWKNRSFIALNGRLVDFLLSSCPNLRVLDLRTGIDSPPDSRGARGENLVSLRLPWIPFDAAAPLLDLKKLKELDVHIEPAKLNEVLGSLPNIRCLTFTRHGRGGLNDSPPDTPIPEVSTLKLDDSESTEEYLPDLPSSLVSARLVGAQVDKASDDQTKLLARLSQITSISVRHSRMKDIIALDRLENLASLELHDLPNLPQILVATSATWGPRLRRFFLVSRSSMFEISFLLRKLSSKNMRELTLKCSSPLRHRMDIPQPVNYPATPSPQNRTPTTQMGFLPALFPHLTLLCLEGFEITDIDAFLLALSLPKGPRKSLKVLSLCDQPGMAPDPLLDCLRRLSALECLSLGAANIDDRVLAEILCPTRRSRSDSTSSAESFRRDAPMPSRHTKLRIALFPRNPAINLLELPGLLAERDGVPRLEMLDLLETRATESGVADLKAVAGLESCCVRIGAGAPLEEEDWLLDSAFV